MPFNLITHSWLPLRRRSGARSVVRPAEIVDRQAQDPFVAVDWPRADFRVATLEFLIGLLAVARPPVGHGAWVREWREPPSVDVLDAAFAPLAHAFDLDGPGPCFMQDFDPLEAEIEPIERLLIEAPGGSTIAKNTDLLVKRDRIGRLGRPAAAMALFTLQSWAPSGGAGNRTGLRGGGPMITLALPTAPQHDALWRLIWANLPCGEAPSPDQFQRIFPWLAPTLTSEGTRTVTPDVDAHPLQAFWGMPRRIRLVFSAPEEPSVCDLTGEHDAVAATGWRQRPRGANYAAWGRRHPLTPHYQVKLGEEWLPLHPQPGGVGFRHWLGLVMRSPDGLRYPADSVSTWLETRLEDADEPVEGRMLAAGFDMDNMKARAFVESEMPLPVGAAEARVRLFGLALAMVTAAEEAARLLRKAVRDALFAPGASVKLDADLFQRLREEFWEQTEALFLESLSSSAKDSAILSGAEPERLAWAKHLRVTALRLFDAAAPLSPEVAALAAERLSRSRRILGATLAGSGKAGAAFFGLLALPPSDTSRRSAA